MNPQGQKKETFGFLSISHPTALPELKLLETRLMALIRDIEFRNYTNEIPANIFCGHKWDHYGITGTHYV